MHSKQVADFQFHQLRTCHLDSGITFRSANVEGTVCFSFADIDMSQISLA
jgi:hypothetical protein